MALAPPSPILLLLRVIEESVVFVSRALAIALAPSGPMLVSES